VKYFSYWHKPTRRSYSIVGAKYSCGDKKAFVVREREKDPKERVFLIELQGELTFDAPRADIEALWSSLYAIEAKRTKRESDKAVREERKRLARVRRQWDLDEEAEQEALSVERPPWTFEPETDSTDDDDEPSKADVKDEDIVESEIIDPQYAA
jgi:hypothetical protein